MKKILTTSFILLLLNFSFARLIYVAQDASGNNDGSSWTDAYTNLQDALETSSWSGNDTLWVKAGTYYPDRRAYGQPGQGNSRDWKFFCPKPVHIFGGFAGTESNLGQRNWQNNSTLLDGDIGTAGDPTDNVWEVIFLGNGPSTYLDGFTIQNGYGDSNSNRDGGGLKISGMSNVTLKNLIIKDNYVIGKGGGLHVSSISLGEFSNIYAFDNEALGDGGGYYLQSLSSLTLSNLFAYNNIGQRGGGIYANSLSNLNVEGVVLCGNRASLQGGGMYASSFSGVTMVNTSLTFNESDQDGGGLYALNFSSCNFTNSTCYSNRASRNYGGFYMTQSSNINLYNSIFWSNNDQNGETHLSSQVYKTNQVSNMEIAYSILQGSNGSGPNWQATVSDAGQNMDADPNLFQAAGPDNITCTLDDNYAPASGSPAIDAGTASAPGINPQDPSGNTRVQGNTVDLGAFESQPSFPVEWLSFEGKREESGIRLTWATASERNSQSFSIERSTDGESWEVIGSKEAQGYSSQVSNYEFMDHIPPRSSKLSYRLLQIDRDGSYSYSHTIELFSEGGNTPLDVDVYPNPSRGKVEVMLHNFRGHEPVQVAIRNLEGQIVYETRFEVLISNKIPLDLNSLSGGYYILSISQGNMLTSSPVVKE